MSNFEESLYLLKEELDNQDVTKLYLELQNSIENNAELTYLSDQINYYKRVMTLNEDNDDIYFEAKTEYEELQKKYNNHPLVVNFNQIKDELASVLTDIKEIIEK